MILVLIAGLTLSATSVALLVFGLNLLYLSWRALCLRPSPSGTIAAGDEPAVCVQLPIYNERHVAERVIDAACNLDWPADRLEVQVLDDSDDETRLIVARAVGRWRSRGVSISHVRRLARTGYKAGALNDGMGCTTAEYLAVFDADFVPPPDFLRRMLPAFADPSVGFAQARWGHLNEAYSWLTRLQALAIDYHFLVEQAVRAGSGYLTNFTGTAGVWRRSAIVDAGGWSSDTLTEDLDLSYRAQLRGWRPSFHEDVVVREELPVEVAAYRRQQLRWATGSFQTAFKLLPALMRSGAGRGVRWQGAVQLLSYAVGPLMLLQLACYPVLLVAQIGHLPVPGLARAALAINLISVAPTVGFVVAQRRRGRGWWHGLPALFCQVLGAGLSLTAVRALVRSRHPGGEFQRTPKYRIERPEQEWRTSEYVGLPDGQVVVEAVLAVGALAVGAWAVKLGSPFVALYSTLFGAGLAALAGLTAGQAVGVVTLRRLGADALVRLRREALLGGLLAVAAALLGAVSLIGDPFEDSYHHWLVAAYLAQTGHLHDPLFGMEDTWLPGYHLLAAGLLRVFGLWQMGVLKAASAVLGLATLAAVYKLADSARQARMAVVLLALNPIFLLTTTSVVAEPLTTALLTGGALAATRRRLGLAALALAGACFTATKAWIWLVALLGVLVLERLGQRRTPRQARARLAWAVPAIVVLGLMQIAFTPATHSVARAAIEVGSATARGSLPGSPWARLGDFAGYFALAALPLVLLAPVGIISELRAGAAARARVRLLYIPALAYLGVVTVLVAGGQYTGSHRYYYPALPALALIAASGLARLPGPASLFATAAAGVAAVMFVPVFVSFAGGNAGVAAAGQASAVVPGRMLTDSPVAAYNSHKPPTDIVGSRSLPADSVASIGWLQAQGITSLVVEDIDYYRASAVFPQLASGQASAPFSRLNGDAYVVPGGKPVHAYRLNADAYQAPLPGPLTIELPLAAPGTGPHLAGPAGSAAGGAGLGSPRLHTAAGWLEPDSGEVADLSSPSRTSWRKTYAFSGAGRVEVVYSVVGSTVQVSARALELSPSVDGVALLNQESASFDDFADSSQTVTGAALWGSVAPSGAWARLRSQTLQMEWSVPARAGVDLSAQRTGDAAGLDFTFGPGWTGADYSITAGRAR